MKRLVHLLSPLALIAISVVPALGQLPDGEGRDTYEYVCGSCHGADIVIGSQGTRARWEETVQAMRDRGAYASDAEFKIVTDYLTRYFGLAVNINAATAEQLVTEFGITAEEAAAIVKHRTEMGALKTWEDVTKVAGVDMAKLEPLKGRITFQ